ncbi:MAG: TlpA disulfide reductase family protein [Planctomycetota bacterium]
MLARDTRPVRRPTGWLAAIAAIALLAMPAVAQEDAGGEADRPRSEAELRLLEAREAIQKLESLNYKANISSEGALLGAIEQVDIEVWLRRQGEPPAAQWDHRRQGDARLLGIGDVRFDIGRLGTVTSYIDHERRIKNIRFHRAARHKTITVADSAWITELIVDQPFARELDGPDSQHELIIGGDTVGEVVCDVVVVDMGEQRPTIRWSIAQSDDLPRRMDMRLNESNRKVLTVTSLTKNPELPDSFFEPERPAGYAQNDQSARARQARGAQQQRQAPTYPEAQSFDVEIVAGPREGQNVTLGDLAERVVVLDFWASWSGASKQSRGDIQKVHEAFEDQPVTVLSLPWRERRPDAARKARDAAGGTYDMAASADEVAMAYGIEAFPTVIIVDQQQRVVDGIAEYNPDTFLETLTAAIQKALDGGYDVIEEAGQAASGQLGGGNTGGGNSGGGNTGGGNSGGGNSGGGN